MTDQKGLALIIIGIFVVIAFAGCGEDSDGSGKYNPSDNLTYSGEELMALLANPPPLDNQTIEAVLDAAGEFIYAYPGHWYEDLTVYLEVEGSGGGVYDDDDDDDVGVSAQDSSTKYKVTAYGYGLINEAGSEVEDTGNQDEAHYINLKKEDGKYVVTKKTLVARTIPKKDRDDAKALVENEFEKIEITGESDGDASFWGWGDGVKGFSFDSDRVEDLDFEEGQVILEFKQTFVNWDEWEGTDYWFYVDLKTDKVYSAEPKTYQWEWD